MSHYSGILLSMMYRGWLKDAVFVSAICMLASGEMLAASDIAVLAPVQTEVPTEANAGSLRQSLEIQLAEIRPGMKRSEVESRFFRVRDGGPQGLTTTRYDEGPGFIIEVPYDESGGAWGPNNLVTGQPAVVQSPGQAF